MLIKEVMSSKVVSTTPEESLVKLVKKFIRYNFHTLPVIESEGQVVGIVDYEDIMKVFTPHNPALEKLLKSTHMYNIGETDILETELPEDIGTSVTVADIMETDIITVGIDDDVSVLRSKMKQYNVERVPVIEEGRLVGIITLFDVIVAVFKGKGVL
ncbi:MAG: CBS domain-containing protein [Proteobacteria bacterium]|nr:CBS domain-containing protein [Pseudomonadota bacterium]